MKVVKIAGVTVGLVLIRDLLGAICISLFSQDQIMATCLMDVLCILIGGFACRKFFSFGKSLEDVLPVTDNSRTLGILLLSGVACWFVSQIMASGIYYLLQDSSFDVYSSSMDATDPLFLFVLTCVIAPIAEEIFFRGCLFGALRKYCTVVTAAVVSSAVFAYVHGTLTHLPVTITVGMLGCALYDLTGQLRWSIGMHMLVNVLSYFVGMIALPIEVVVNPVWVVLWAVLFAFIGAVLVGEGRVLQDETTQRMGPKSD